MQLGREPDGQAAVLGIDIGSSYIKAHVLAVSVHQGKVKFHDKGSPYPDLRPRPSTVNGNQSSLQQWRNTRSGQITNRLTYGRSTSKRYFQLVNPKRCFLVQHSEVDAAKLARDTGLPAEAAVVNEEGFMSMEVSPGTVISMDDVFGAMVHDILVDLHRSGHYSSILAVAVTLPNTISRAGRARAWIIIRQQLDIFSSEQGFSMLRHNEHPPYIGIIPEGVAVARELCGGELKGQEGPVRVMTVDSGHSTLDVSQMTIKQVDGVLDISDVINTGDSFCGVKDVALALLGRLPAAVLRQAAQDADRSGSLYGVNEILDYTDEMVVGGSQRNLAAADKIASSSTPLSLSEQAPVTFGDVVEASKVLSAPGDKVVRRNLLLGELCGHQPPAVVYMTGGGGMVPALKDAVESAVGPDTRIVPSLGGNRQPVARGAALLLFDGLQRHHNQQLQQDRRRTRAAASSSSGHQHGPYLHLLPDYWAAPLGCSIGVWSAFSAAHIEGISDVQQLEDLKQRVTAAALKDGANATAAPEPDVATRKRHQQQMLDYISYRLAVLQQQQQQPAAPRGRGRPHKAPQGRKAPKIDKDIFFYYSLLLPESSVPCEPVKLPWKLYKPADGDTLRVQLVRLDPLGVEAETFAGDYLVPAPDADHFVQLAVAVDEHGMIVCQAHLKHRDDSDELPGQPLDVKTSHDRYAAQRHDKQQRVHQLPPHVQDFLRQLNGEEAAAVASSAAAVAPLAAAAQPTSAAAGGSDQIANGQHRQPHNAVALSGDSLLAAAQHALNIESELDLVHPLMNNLPSPQHQAAGSSHPVPTLPVEDTLSHLQLVEAVNGVRTAAIPTVAGNNNQADRNITANKPLALEAGAGVAAAVGAADCHGGANDSGSARIPAQCLAPVGAAIDAMEGSTLGINGVVAGSTKEPAVALATVSAVTNVSSMKRSSKKRKHVQAPSSVVREAVAAKQSRVTRSILARTAQQ